MYVFQWPLKRKIANVYNALLALALICRTVNGKVCEMYEHRKVPRGLLHLIIGLDAKSLSVHPFREV